MSRRADSPSSANSPIFRAHDYPDNAGEFRRYPGEVHLSAYCYGSDHAECRGVTRREGELQRCGCKCHRIARDWDT